MNDSFHQIPLSPESYKYTAFVTPSGKLYEYKFVPYGTKVSTAAFQRALDLATTGMKYVDLASFIDDLLIPGETWNIHMNRLNKILEKLNEFGFTLKSKKCAFGMNKVVFLGYLVSENTISPAPALLQAIDKLQVPTNVTEVRSILGVLSYTRKCIKDFSINVEPISRLTKKNQPFIWGTEQNNAFNSIKNLFKNKPYLVYFDPNRETQLSVDASLIGLGGALTQKHGDIWLPVGYYSRLLNETERKYAIYDLEVMAAIESMNYFNDLLIGHYFTLITDNRAVSFIRKKKQLNGRLARIAMFLEEFDFTIKLKPGSKNALADFLSRYPSGHKLCDGKNITIDEINEYENSINAINTLIISNLNSIENNLSDESIISWQTNDSELSEIIHILRIKNLNTDNKYFKYIKENFKFENNVLLKFSVDSLKGAKLTVCVPFDYSLKILEYYHDLSTSGHLGQKRTLFKLNERFFWPNLAQFVKFYIKSCKLCQFKKSPKTKPLGLMQPIITSSVFELTAIDHLGPFVKSNGYQYIIVLTDNFSKLAICKPVTSMSAKNVAKFLFEDLILTYAVIPNKLLSDCSQSFLGSVVSHLNIFMGIKQLKTSGYKPSTNSITERFNATLAECLSLYVNEKQTDWYKFVKPVVFAYNCTVQASTGYSPIEIIYGRKAEFPPDVNMQLSKIRGTPSEYALGLANYLKDVKSKVFDRLMSVHLKDKNRFDKKRKNFEFSLGSNVLFYNPAIYPGKQNKLLKRWEGPFKIVRQVSPLLYQLDFKATALKSNICHIQRLKPFYDRKDLNGILEQIRRPFIPKTVLKHKSCKKFDSIESSESDDSVDSEDNTTADLDLGPDSEDNSELTTDMYENHYSDYSSDSESDCESIDELNNDLNEPIIPLPDPNYNVNQGLRRSIRLKRSPNRLNLYLASILCIFCVFSTTDALASVEPIIWHRIENPVIEGLDTVTAVIDYQSPCFLFDELLINSDQTIEMRNWCENLFQINFINPINDFCTTVGNRDSAKFGLIREKRFIITGIIALITVVSVIASIGLSATSMVKSYSADSKIDILEEQSRIAMKNLNHLRLNDRTHEKILYEFSQVLKNLTNEVITIRNDLNIVKNTAPKAMRIISLLTTKLYNTKNDLNEISRDFKKGKLNSKFLELFNYTNPCGDRCPPEFWSSQKCLHDEMRHMIVVKYTMKVVNPNMHVLTADPFDLVKIKINGKQKELCHSEYIGPKAVLFDEKNHCVKPIRGNPKENSNLVLVEKDYRCNQSDYNPGKINYWVEGKCEKPI